MMKDSSRLPCSEENSRTWLASTSPETSTRGSTSNVMAIATTASVSVTVRSSPGPCGSHGTGVVSPTSTTISEPFGHSTEARVCRGDRMQPWTPSSTEPGRSAPT